VLWFWCVTCKSSLQASEGQMRQWRVLYKHIYIYMNICKYKLLISIHGFLHISRLYSSRVRGCGPRPIQTRNPNNQHVCCAELKFTESKGNIKERIGTVSDFYWFWIWRHRRPFRSSMFDEAFGHFDWRASLGGTVLELFLMCFGPATELYLSKLFLWFRRGKDVDTTCLPQ